MTARYTPAQVIPESLDKAVEPLPYWFVIGGQAVRCFAPYRPSLDVDFGIESAANLDDFVGQLRRRGKVEVQERTADTAHLLWNDTRVSVFLLPHLVAHVTDRHLDVTGILATKLHAILDRGARRDFFDLYVMLQQERLGIVAALSALRVVYRQQVDDGLLLRALTYFDDAAKEAPLPGEGPRDFALVKRFFQVQVGSLLMPPARPLAIQANVVDVRAADLPRATKGARPRRATRAPRR